MSDPRIQELLDLAERTGIQLPYAPELIVAQEDLGNVVDLITGDILIGESDAEYFWALTASGVALADWLDGEVQL